MNTDAEILKQLTDIRTLLQGTSISINCSEKLHHHLGGLWRGKIGALTNFHLLEG